MQSYVIRRLALVLPTIFIVCLIIFFVSQVIPGTAIELMLGEMEGRLTPEMKQELRAEMGVDKPVHVQFGVWFWDILQGRLGKSFWGGIPVVDQLRARMPVTAELGLMAIATGMLIAIPIGVYSAIRQDTLGDYVGRSFAIMCISVPGFWLGTLIMVYPSMWWGWAPAFEYIPLIDDPLGNLQQFIIPAVVLGMALSGTSMRMTRTMMLEVLRQDYIRTAWAKGLRERTVVMRHALKNALIPVVTLLGLHVPVIVGGAIVIEQIFCLPGIGTYLIESLHRRDYMVLSGLNLFVASLVMLTNLVVDLSYAYLDPRVQYQ